MADVNLRDFLLFEAAESGFKAELDMLREFYAAATAPGMAEIEAVHEYECAFWRVGKGHGTCNCGGSERQERVDKALAALAEAAEDGIPDHEKMSCT